MKYLKLFALVFSVTFIGCGGNDSSNNNADNTPATPPVKAISYSIIKSFPHDTASYTQGLQIYKGKLYEGTGGNTAYGQDNKGYSELMVVNLATGKKERGITLDKKYFGEGITVLNDTVYQLTWQDKVVFAYTLKDFKKIKEFSINTEGWGMTSDGKELIVSDGTSNLYFYNPSDFKLLRTQSVTMGSELVNSINELEWIDGFIYANQYQQPYILKIDPHSGDVAGRIDLTQIWDRVKKIDPQADVPNGIAYDADTKKIYITGKKWPELYEVQFSQ